MPLALAASLVLVVAGAFVYEATARSTQLLAAELTADHLKCFRVINNVLGTHHEPQAVESSMASGFDWQMRLPEHAERVGLELVGARPCLYGEGIVAHIMYRHNGHPVSIFMLPQKRAHRRARRGDGASGRDLVGGQPDVRAGRARASRRSGAHDVVRPRGSLTVER